MEDSSSEEYVSADEGINENSEKDVRSSKSAEYIAPQYSAELPGANGVQVQDRELSESPANQIPAPGPPEKTPPPSGDQTYPSQPEQTPPPLGDEHPPPDLPGQTPTPPGDQTTPPPPLLAKEELSSADDPPVPPPRRKRKKKYQKQPSLENLTEIEDHPQSLTRSLTVGSTDLTKVSRQAVKTVGQPSSSKETVSSSSREEVTPSSREEASPSSCESASPSSREEATPFSREEATPFSREEATPSSRGETSPSSHEEESFSSMCKETSLSHEEATPSCSSKEATPTLESGHVCTTCDEVAVVQPQAQATGTENMIGETGEVQQAQATGTENMIGETGEVQSGDTLPMPVTVNMQPTSSDESVTKPSTSSASGYSVVHAEQEGRGTSPAKKGGQGVSSEPDQRSSENSEEHLSLMRDPVSRSRSVTPTPAISIEPDLGLEWTADMLSLPESEVVTSDTNLAKARGSNTTTTSSIVFPSDDDSIDGVFGEDTPDEGGEGDSEGGGDSTYNSSKQSSEPVAMQSAPVDSDNAILESTMVTNLDTGEVIPLSAAEEKIPQGHGWSPLSEHLLRRTKEIAEAAGQSGYSFEDEYASHAQRRKTRKKTFINLKKWGRKRDRMGGGDEGTGLSEETTLNVEDKYAVKYKQASHKQHNQEFDKVRLKQDLTGTHLGAIWAMEFSICGRLLATAGQDSVVRVWVLATAAVFFHELQAQYQRLGVHSSVDSLSEKASVASSSSKSSEEDDNSGGKLPFQEHPLCSYYGHTADVLDLSWSKNFFLLSSSMDKTVRLWHISRKECLCCFQHVDFVTAIAFHPRDDRYFLSGSLDGKLRLWNIPDKKVALWNEIEGVGSHLITAANFCMNGKLAVVGTYDGRCMFYDTEHLKYHTQIHVKSRHGKNKGRKISGVEPLPGEDKLLVTSNDSRIRLYNLKDHELSCKYKGCLNTSSQIKATFSRDGQYIISGSEDNFIYLWKTHLDVNKLSSARRDRNEFYESFSSHSAPVTTAVFAPVPGITVDEGIKEVGEIVVAADYQGSIKIYVSGEKL